jgi:hypothetical protein
MSKTSRPGNVQAGTDLASALLLLLGFMFVTLFHLALLLKSPRKQAMRAARATRRGTKRLYSYASSNFKASRFAQSMRELMADSS